MSTLHDLRETLEHHADGLADTERHARPADVRARIRVARRRRSGVAAAAVVAVVAGVAAVGSLQWPGEVEPAAATVVGVAVPEQVTILGSPYELTGGDPIEDREDRLRLSETDHGRAVTLVADGLGRGSATLYANGLPVARAFGSDPVSLPVTLPDGVASTLRVQLDGAPPRARAGVALYAPTGELAPGVDDGSVVFRRSVGDDQLLAAAFAEQGEARAAISFTAPMADLRITAHCRTEESGLWLRVELDGRESMSGQCGDGFGADADGSSWSGGARASRPHTVTALVTRGEDGEVVRDADVDLGVAAYDRGRTVRMAGADVAAVVEHAGRTWRLDAGVSRAITDDHSRRLETPDTDLLLGFVAKGETVRATWRGELSRGGTAYVDGSLGSGVLVDGLLLRGDSYAVALEADGPVNGSALLVYRPV